MRALSERIAPDGGGDTAQTQRTQGAPTGPSLVVIVAGTRAEQQRLLQAIPEEVPVLLAASREGAQEVLRGRVVPPTASTPAPPGPPPVAPPLAAPPVVETLGLRIRLDDRTVSSCGGQAHLTPLELALLRALASPPGRVCSFSELSRRVWSTGLVGDGAQVRAVVKRLRRKLAEIEAPVVVETVRGAGLRLVPGRPGA